MEITKQLKMQLLKDTKAASDDMDEHKRIQGNTGCDLNWRSQMYPDDTPMLNFSLKNQLVYLGFLRVFCNNWHDNALWNPKCVCKHHLISNHFQRTTVSTPTTNHGQKLSMTTYLLWKSLQLTFRYKDNILKLPQPCISFLSFSIHTFSLVTILIIDAMQAERCCRKQQICIKVY